MHRSDRNSPPPLEGDDDQKMLHIAIFSDGAASSQRASQSIEVLMHSLKPEFEFDFRFAPMTSLGSADSLPTLDSQIQWADVIVFSFSEATTLNKRTRQWFETSLESERRQPQALAVLCSTAKGHPGCEAPSLVAFLRDTASRHGLDFFAEVRHPAPAGALPPGASLGSMDEGLRSESSQAEQ